MAKNRWYMKFFMHRSIWSGFQRMGNYNFYLSRNCSKIEFSDKTSWYWYLLWFGWKNGSEKHWWWRWNNSQNSKNEEKETRTGRLWQKIIRYSNVCSVVEFQRWCKLLAQESTCSKEILIPTSLNYLWSSVVGVLKVDYLDFPCEIFEILCELDVGVIACIF